MFDREFYKGYVSKNAQIKEGYAYAISEKWYTQFQTFLENPREADIQQLGQIKNHNICDIIQDFNPNLDCYMVPQQHSINFRKVHKLKPGLIQFRDYYIVSIDIWKLLNMCFHADYEVIVFVTKVLQGMRNYSFCDNLEQGYCICDETFYLIFVIVEKDDKSNMLAIKMPACPWIGLTKFQNFLFTIIEHKLDSQKFINQGHLYYNGKKVPFQGNQLLKDIGITKETQIILSCPNMTLEDIEQEIETDGEDRQIQQNQHSKQEFLEILEQNMKHQSNELTLKSQQEIKQSLEQNDFFQV
ncbi:unnamed protein product [Paramecium octaurelia]|uniref:DUSP domain-containing protein n=1 Tax=Paramecium octaurelia TaxID=43137 RepID=A0A8S1X725_PAROT|nr:unnamed protein product [Paramecium octaurelia]